MGSRKASAILPVQQTNPDETAVPATLKKVKITRPHSSLPMSKNII
jgi:hypothetical protein